jgi:hypothetical protein
MAWETEKTDKNESAVRKPIFRFLKPVRSLGQEMLRQTTSDNFVT